MGHGMTAVIFDLDGTLLDSAPDLHAAALAMLDEAGLPPVTYAQTRNFIGNGVPKLVERLIGAAGGDSDRQTDLLGRFTYHYALDPVSRTQFYPGVPEALDALAAAGYLMAICTNKPEVPARAVAEHFGLTARMGAIVGGDTLAVRKPDPAPLHHAIRALGRNEVLYVGDSETDADTARAAEVPFALFTEGYRKTPTDGIFHDHRFDRFVELPGIAKTVFSAN